MSCCSVELCCGVRVVDVAGYVTLLCHGVVRRVDAMSMC